MRSFLLLLSFITGCEASYVWGCRGGWVNLTLKYPETNETYTSIEVLLDQDKIIQITHNDTWANQGVFSMYHDKQNKSLRVGIKPISKDDYGKYKFKFKSDGKSISNGDQRVKLKSDNPCQKPFHLTVSRTAEARISCGNKEYEDNYRVKFFCKENGPICEDVLSTKSALRSNGSFTLTEKERGFTVSISNVSAQDAGVYWCGVESTEIRYRAALRKIQLKVEDGPLIFIPVIIRVAVWLLLLSVLILILICTRYSKNKRNAAAEQHVPEILYTRRYRSAPRSLTQGMQ
ncbi:uncharacterized protein LOC134882823 isoform X3 [Eleginops maclovinus]|uniref:uncharacterized protein LOC134882823 isoform X3 n=1 Tax=Eleginops maclovinus TaxID=56733 RepID=UPI00307FDD88